LADFSVAIHNMSCAYEKMNFAEWLKYNLEELSTLEKLGLTKKSEKLKESIKKRYRVAFLDEENPLTQNDKLKIKIAIEEYQSPPTCDDDLFKDINLRTPLSDDEKNEEKEIKKKLQDEFNSSVFNFIARSATLIGLLLLKVLIVSAAWQPYAPLIFLGAGALMYGYRTVAKPAFNAMHSCFFPPAPDATRNKVAQSSSRPSASTYNRLLNH
jgi:hypothetical protein